jgi:hypothetical protein
VGEIGGSSQIKVFRREWVKMSVSEGARERASLARKSSGPRMVAVQQNECGNSSAKCARSVGKSVKSDSQRFGV